MYNLDKAYSKKFFARRKSLAWRIPIVCDAIIEVLEPQSVIDVGCGNGDLVKGFKDRNIKRVFGIEGTYNFLYGVNSNPCDVISVEDLRIKGSLAYYDKFDLAICFEVAEHIEPKYTDIFLANLCSVSDRILFSAASPGQGGVHHHNCRSNEYWIDKFCTDKGYSYRPYYTMALRKKWAKWKNKKGIKAYFQNLLYFERDNP